MNNPLERVIMSLKAASPMPADLFARDQSRPMATDPLTFPGWDKLGDNSKDEQAAMKALQVSWVYAGIAEIARLMSVAQLEVVEVEGEDTAQVIDHPLERIWNAPNRFMGRSYLIENWVWSKYLGGAAYMYTAPDQSTATSTGWEIGEIWPLPTFLMRIVGDGKDYIKGYNFFKDGFSAKPVFFPAEVVLYSRFPDPFDPTFRGGMSPLKAARIAYEMDYNQSKWNMSFFSKHSAIPNTIVSTRPEISEADFRRFRDELFSFYGGNEQRTMVARGGDVKVEALGFSQKDMDFITSREMSRKEIDRVLGFPEGYWSESANRANAQNARTTFIDGTIWSLMVSLAEDLNAQLSPNYAGLQENQRIQFADIRHRDRELLRREQDSRRHYWTVNELRQVDDKDPLPGEQFEHVPASLASVQATGDPGDNSAGNGQGSELDIRSVDHRPLELKRWETKALRRLKAGKAAACDFKSDHLGGDVTDEIKADLEAAASEEEVRAVFAARLFRY